MTSEHINFDEYFNGLFTSSVHSYHRDFPFMEEEKIKDIHPFNIEVYSDKLMKKINFTKEPVPKELYDAVFKDYEYIEIFAETSREKTRAS